MLYPFYIQVMDDHATATRSPLLAASSRWELNVSSARNLDKVNTPMASLCNSTCAEKRNSLDALNLDLNHSVNEH